MDHKTREFFKSLANFFRLLPGPGMEKRAVCGVAGGLVQGGFWAQSRAGIRDAPRDSVQQAGKAFRPGERAVTVRQEVRLKCQARILDSFKRSRYTLGQKTRLRFQHKNHSPTIGRSSPEELARPPGSKSYTVSIFFYFAYAAAVFTGTVRRPERMVPAMESAIIMIMCCRFRKRQNSSASFFATFFTSSF